MWSVYVHTFPNGKKYVGVTSQTPATLRWRSDGSGYQNQKQLANAIKKYGWDNVSHEIIQETESSEEAFETEKKLISEFKSNEREFGYNLSEGGESGAKGAHWSEERKKDFSERFSGEKHPWFGRHHSEESKQKMREWRTGWKHSESSVAKIKAVQEKRMKKVVCYETRAIYGSFCEAAEINSLKESNLVEACNHFPKKTCGGFHWYRLEDYPVDYVCEIPKNTKAPRPVIRLDSLIVYQSIGEAARSCNLDPRHISRCCRERTRVLNGTQWRFQEEYEKECATSLLT